MLLRPYERHLFASKLRGIFYFRNFILMILLGDGYNLQDVPNGRPPVAEHQDCHSTEENNTTDSHRAVQELPAK